MPRTPFLLSATLLAAFGGVLGGCGLGEPPRSREAEPGALGAAIEAMDPAGTQPETDERSARAYVTIRYDRPAPAYDDALYQALQRAFERYPRAEFDIVLAIPALDRRESPAEAFTRGEEQIEDVVLAMTGMGMPPTRLRIAAMTDTSIGANEVRIFVRPPTL